MACIQRDSKVTGVCMDMRVGLFLFAGLKVRRFLLALREGWKEGGRWVDLLARE